VGGAYGSYGRGEETVQCFDGNARRKEAILKTKA
jgi:hypothetical protein